MRGTQTASAAAPPAASRMSAKPRKRTTVNDHETARESAVVAEHLLSDPARIRAGLADVKHERAVDGVRVGRHDPPGDRVRPLGQLAIDPDRDLVGRRPGGAPVVDAPRLSVEDAHRAERCLDRLAEAQGHLRRRGFEHGVVGRRGRRQIGMGVCAGSHDEREQRRREHRTSHAPCDMVSPGCDRSSFAWFGAPGRRM